jgi:hypothetical protein
MATKFSSYFNSPSTQTTPTVASTQSTNQGTKFSSYFNKTQPQVQSQSSKPLTIPMAGNVGVGTNAPQFDKFNTSQQAIQKSVFNPISDKWNQFLTTTDVGKVVKGFMSEAGQSLPGTPESFGEAAAYSPPGALAIGAIKAPKAISTLVKTVAKEVKPRVIESLLKSVFPDIAESLFKPFAQKLAPITDAKVVQKELDTFIATKLPVGKEIKINSNFKSAEDFAKSLETQPLAEEARKLEAQLHPNDVVGWRADKEINGWSDKQYTQFLQDRINDLKDFKSGAYQKQGTTQELQNAIFDLRKTEKEIGKPGLTDFVLKNISGKTDEEALSIINQGQRAIRDGKFEAFAKRYAGQVSPSSLEGGVKTGKQLEQGMQKTVPQPALADTSSTVTKARPLVEKAQELQTELKTVRQELKKSGQASEESIAQMPKAQDEIINSFKNATPKEKVGILDYLRTPDRVLQKIGLGKEAALLKQKYRDYIIDLPKEIDKVTQWAKRANDKGSSERVFKYLDGQEVKLQGDELKVANEIKGYFKEWADKLKLPEDKRISNYITHMFEEDLIKKEFDSDLAKIIADKVPGSVYDPFLLERYGVQGYKQDAWQALDAYVKRATRKFHMDVALEPLKRASEMLDLESFNYVKRLADRVNLRPTEIDSLIDNFIKATPVGYKLGGRPVARVSRALRQIVYRGTLGLNIGSAFRNLTQGANTYAKLGEKYTIKGYYGMIKDVLSRGNELQEVGVLVDNIVQDRTLNATKKFWEKADKGLFSFFSAAERINRGAAYFGSKAKALANGATEQDAIKAGIKTVEDTQFVFGSVDTPVALQNDIVKVLTQFQSFNVKQTEFLGEMIKNKEFGGLVRFAGANVAMYLTIGQLFGMKPTDMIPFFSNVTQGRFATPPLQAAGSGIKSVVGNEQQREEGQTELKKVAPAFIPAGVQAKKTIEGVGAYQQGASTTPTGRTRFEVEKTPENLLRSAIFGQYTLPGADKYFENLGKSKSELIYKEITKLKTKDERVNAWNKMVDDGVITKGNVSDVQQWFDDEQLKTTKEERRWRSLGIQDGSRARAVVKEIKKFKTNKERVDYFNALVEKKIITSQDLADQITELLK